MKHLNIGLFGFGTVGGGIYQVISTKPQIGAEVKKIVIKDPEKTRDAPAHLFSENALDILDDQDIDLVVELIDDPEAAYEIVVKAFNSGKSVVSANKKMIAEHHLELIALSKENNVSFLYEAAACGSVPIIRNLEEYFDSDLLTSLQGIVNGSTNYILSKMLSSGESYEGALKDAQENGFAESDPCLDVDGIDAAFKLSILILHAFGKHIERSEILLKGISSLSSFDLQYAKEKGKVIKLIASSEINEQGEVISASVIPTFVESTSPLGQTKNEYNAVIVQTKLSDQQLFYGKGAGRYPTSSAVLSDICAFKYNYKYEYKKGTASKRLEPQGSGKYYVSFNNDVVCDTRIFSQVDEYFVSRNRTYLTGDIAIKDLMGSDVLTNKAISLVRID